VRFCLYFAFPNCLFRGSDDIYYIFSLLLYSELSRLNNQLFGGAPVLAIHNMKYTLNTDYLQPLSAHPEVVFTTAPAGAYAYPTTASHGGYTPTVAVAGPSTGTTYATAEYAELITNITNYEYAKVQQVEPSFTNISPNALPSSSTTGRQMAVTIPHGVHPGQILTVQAPDGSVIQVRGPSYFCICVIPLFYYSTYRCQ
jgi:hypothetical protein